MRNEVKFMGIMLAAAKTITTIKVFTPHPYNHVNSIYFDDFNLSNFIDGEEGTVQEKGKTQMVWFRPRPQTG